MSVQIFASLLVWLTLAASGLFLTACSTPPVADFTPLRAKDSPIPAEHLALLQTQGETITGRPFVDGNKIELLRDGNATFPAMLAAIRHAKKYINMESFTFDDKAGKRFAKALINRRQHGVKVNLIYDAFGSSDTPPGIFDYMRAHGITLLEFNPITVGEVMDMDANHRDHRKLLIVDGKEAFVGGVNISAVYLHKKKLKEALGNSDKDDADPLPWRDTHIKITGPAVREFEHAFRQTWVEQHGSPVAFNWPLDGYKSGDWRVEALLGAPTNGHYDIYESLLMAITLAQHSVHLTTGFFAPTPELMEALEKAARRGVDVELMLPSTSDSDMALAAGHASYHELLESGVRIYEIQGAVLHAKTSVIDGMWSTVGSANLDWRSAVLNNECNAVILGAVFGAQMETLFHDDVVHSKAITLEDWGGRPFEERLQEMGASWIDYFL